VAFKYETTVKLYDTDAAGLIFFGHQFRIAHDAYQAYLESCGFSFGKVLQEGEMLIPIVHAEADYLKPLAVGDRLAIELTASKISSHSFVLHYELYGPDNALVGTVTSVHVTVSRVSDAKIELPSDLRTAIEKIFVPRD
jgi:1,4-dihydroxy-2-naphthoyl-CoA hydrolase